MVQWALLSQGLKVNAEHDFLGKQPDVWLPRKPGLQPPHLYEPWKRWCSVVSASGPPGGAVSHFYSSWTPDWCWSFKTISFSFRELVFSYEHRAHMQPDEMWNKLDSPRCWCRRSLTRRRQEDRYTRRRPRTPEKRRQNSKDPAELYWL